jgi:predicted transposase YdaD
MPRNPSSNPPEPFLLFMNGMRVHTIFAANPHDHLFRYVFCQPKAIAMVLRRALPKAVLQVLDLGSLRYVPSVHINPRLRRREPDLCFTVDALDEGRRVTIYLVIEHQSRRDGRLPWRSLVYMGETWGRYIQDHPKRRGRIPFMVAVLLTQHPARTTPTRLSSILDVPPRLRQVLGTPVELVVHASDFSGSLLRDRKAPAAIRALVELARAFLHAYDNPGSLTPARLAELAPLVDVLLKHDRPDDVEALWVYAISVFDPKSPIHEMITTAISKPAREMYMSLKDELLARGEKLGEARGRKLGEARGRAIGKAQALLEVLEQRRIPVAMAVRKRILATHDELALRCWLERAIVVTRAAELFERPSQVCGGSQPTVGRAAPVRARRRPASPSPTAIPPPAPRPPARVSTPR